MNKEKPISEAYMKYIINLFRFLFIPLSVEEMKSTLEKVSEYLGKFSDEASKFSYELVNNYMKIVPQIPMQIRIIQIVTILETYLKDKFLEILLQNTKTMKKHYDKAIKIKELFEGKDKDLNRIIAKHITNSYNFQKIEDIKYVFDKSLNITISDDEENTLTKLFHIRHILIHNSGIIDREFKCNVKTDQKEGETIRLVRKEVHELIQSVLEFINKVEEKLDSKFDLHACLVNPNISMYLLKLIY